MVYTKKLKVKILDIDADKQIALLNSRTAKDLLANTQNRVCVKFKDKETNFIIDLTDRFIDENTIGLYRDNTGGLMLQDGDIVEVSLLSTPPSIHFIIDKIRNRPLTEKQITQIISDIVYNRLSDTEISAFLTAITINGLNLDETISMCKAMTLTGKIIEFDRKVILDKHSIGGINGRVSMIVTPIIASCGYYMPKTASRAISSAAGTADSMEVLADVSFDINDIKKIVHEHGGLLAWNGKVDLCPADDKMIMVRHSLGLDPEGLVIASVLSKKKSVSATHLIIDIPVGPTAKVRNREEGQRWANKFIAISKEIGINTKVVLTSCALPCGKYFGPSLEARGALEVLECKYFDSLAEKSCEIAGSLLELVGRVDEGKGYDLAKDTLLSGKALSKFKEILKAQNGRIFESEKIPWAEHKQDIVAMGSGKIVGLDVSNLIKIARTAGAPSDQLAGIVLAKDAGDKIKEGETIFTIHSSNKEKLRIAVEMSKELLKDTVKIEKVILEEMN